MRLRPLKSPENPFVYEDNGGAVRRLSMDWNALMSGPPLRWVQPSVLKMNYELKAGNAVVGTLRFRGAFASSATAENADGCWTFKQTGFFQMRAIIRPCDSETEMAGFKLNAWKGGGTLTLSDGREWLATTNFWQNRMEFQDPAGQVLCRFRNEGVLRTSSKVELEPVAWSAPETSWLVMFGEYVSILMGVHAGHA
jgi:hypothetical protein